MGIRPTCRKEARQPAGPRRHGGTASHGQLEPGSLAGPSRARFAHGHSVARLAQTFPRRLVKSGLLSRCQSPAAGRRRTARIPPRYGPPAPSLRRRSSSGVLSRTAHQLSCMWMLDSSDRPARPILRWTPATGQASLVHPSPARLAHPSRPATLASLRPALPDRCPTPAAPVTSFSNSRDRPGQCVPTRSLAAPNARPSRL